MDCLEYYYIHVSFPRYDNKIVVMQENVCIFRRFMLTYLGVKYHDVETFFQIIQLKKSVCVYREKERKEKLNEAK